MKRCTSCGIYEPFEDFYHNKRSSDGYTHQCKACRKAEYERNKDVAKEYYKKNRQKLIAQAREYTARHGRRNTAVAKRKHNEWTSKYRKGNPDKAKAHNAVAVAIVQGRLPKASDCSCDRCGAAATEYHHWSYNQEHWLDVVPVCHTCHMGIHFSSKSDA